MNADPPDPAAPFAPRRVPPETAKGILRPQEQLRVYSHERSAAGPEVSRYVEWYWAVRWDRRGMPPYRAEILSYPAVNMTFEREPGHRGGFVTGVTTSKYVRELRGEGETFGVKFRAGGFGAFTGMDVGAIRDTAVELTEVLPEAVGLADKVLAATTLADRRLLVEDFFREVAQRRAIVDDTAYQLVLRIVDAMEHDPELTRVDQVTDRFDVPVRTLQRLFRRYVGAGPKWVLRRYRLQDGAYLLAQGRTTDLADLAVELGYFDQSHFCKEFAAEIGMPPLEYARASLASSQE
ncbi:helix-turn-helix transcriptional regulator [Nocardia otitidiscaviarum]|uniref:AraC family transcriptional regulator n=1 Tax=Nocardia otitidiscaviarum TaxID=1823 RepID=UPI0018954DC0|nr:AraC family transcriptional regulator [Nocardia otitidiscaviarum]MBF6239713.1 helix-turn-helix transcriptional regulator [Nocardia otitidiscaviarum]